MKTYICISLNFCLLKLLSELFHSVYVFAFFWGFYVFDDASSEVCPVNFALLLLEHHELKSEQLLDDLSTELHHLLAWNSIWILSKHTLHSLLNWLDKIFDLGFEISRLKTNRLLDKSIIIATHIFKEICIDKKVHLRKSSLFMFTQSTCSSKNFSIFFL